MKKDITTILLGEIRPHSIERPGVYGKVRGEHRIPENIEGDFWTHVFKYISDRENLMHPLRDDRAYINDFFGHYGFQYHPINHQSHYFHTGIDINAITKHDVYPVCSGILEYAGYSLQNGNYVMMSHPHIVTEDGFVMYSLYMHLKEVKVGFSRYQKMLREISMRSYPQVNTPHDMLIGIVGDSGTPEGKHNHLHLQIEFRNKDGSIIAIDPARVLDIEHKENISTQVHNKKEFNALLKDHKKEIEQQGVAGYWSV